MAETDAAVEKKVEVVKKDKLFSKKNRKTLSDPLSDNNPITLQVLGICSALAVTVQVNTALVMSLAVIAVLTISNVTISMLRNAIPNKIRIIGCIIDSNIPFIRVFSGRKRSLSQYNCKLGFTILDQNPARDTQSEFGNLNQQQHLSAKILI